MCCDFCDQDPDFPEPPAHHTAFRRAQDLYTALGPDPMIAATQVGARELFRLLSWRRGPRECKVQQMGEPNMTKGSSSLRLWKVLCPMFFWWYKFRINYVLAACFASCSLATHRRAVALKYLRPFSPSPRFSSFGLLAHKAHNLQWWSLTPQVGKSKFWEDQKSSNFKDLFPSNPQEIDTILKMAFEELWVLFFERLHVLFAIVWKCMSYLLCRHGFQPSAEKLCAAMLNRSWF